MTSSSNIKAIVPLAEEAMICNRAAFEKTMARAEGACKQGSEFQGSEGGLEEAQGSEGGLEEAQAVTPR